MQIHQIKTITSSSVLFRDVSCNCSFNEGPLCKGHEFKERTFNVKPTVRNVDLDILKTKHQQFDDTILEEELKNGMTNVTGSCTGKLENDTDKVAGCPFEEIEDDMEIFTVFSIPHAKESSHDHYSKILEKLRQCKTFNEFRDQCMAIKIKDVQGKERSILECKSTVDQTAMELCPDEFLQQEPYSQLFQAIEMRLRIIIELVLNEDYYMDRKQFEVLSSSGKSKDLRKSFAMYSEAFIPGIHLDDQMIIRIYQQEIMSIATPKNTWECGRFWTG
ncbi:unnamed protein product [Mytilus edulis]|uniref:Uncharacterized protein n=1 Tax=Mytilus edulis TaxID=6550 RepID=A0A8S3VIF5_MYTED|nr:unnamed protein product [Mytilus edulis]